MSILHFNYNFVCVNAWDTRFAIPSTYKTPYNKLTRAIIEASNKPGATNSAGRVATVPNGTVAFITSPSDGLLSTMGKRFIYDIRKDYNKAENNDNEDSTHDAVEDEAEAKQHEEDQTKTAAQCVFTKQ